MNIIKGNIIDFIGKTDIVCVTTNGIVKSNGELVMGGGCAKTFKELYPQIPQILGTKVRKDGNLCYTCGQSNNTYIVSFPTKHHFKENSDLSLIKKSAHRLVKIADFYNAKSIHIPSPGTGLGNLNRAEVYKELSSILDDRFYIVEL